MHAGRTPFCEAKAAPAIAFDVVLLARGIACPSAIAGTSYTRHNGRPPGDRRATVFRSSPTLHRGMHGRLLSFARARDHDCNHRDRGRGLLQGFHEQHVAQYHRTRHDQSGGCAHPHRKSRWRALLRPAWRARIATWQESPAHQRHLSPGRSRQQPPRRYVGAHDGPRAGRRRDIRARLAAHPSASEFTITDVSPVIGAVVRRTSWVRR